MEHENYGFEESGLCSRCKNNTACCMTAPKRTECDSYDKEDEDDE